MNEMIKLVNMLMDNKVQFQMVLPKEYNSTQLYIPNIHRPAFDVVCNKYSEGGKSGLLEILCYTTNNYKGCLHAEDVYDIISMKGCD